MIGMTKVFACIAALVLCASSAQAEIYRWVDKDGKVQFSDMPPPDAKVEKTKIIDNKIESAKYDYDTTRAAKMAPITLYVGADCKEPCDDARKLLGKRKVPFAESMVKTQAELDALAKLTGKKEPRVPTVQIGSRTIEGFEAGSWASAIDTAGYPKAP